MQKISEPKYKILIKNRENVGIKHFNEPNAFIECSNTMDYIDENINDLQPKQKMKNFNCV